MEVRSVPIAAKVKLACAGHGCPFTAHSASVARCKNKTCHAHSRTVQLARLFKRHALRPGARVTVSVTEKNTIGKAFVFTTRKEKQPKHQIGCLAPGSSKLNRGC